MSCGRPDGHDNRGRNTRKRRRSLYTSHRSRYGGLKTTGRFVHPNRTVSNKRERLFTTFRSPVTVVYFPPPHTHTHTFSHITWVSRPKRRNLPRSWSAPNRCTPWPWWPRTVRNSTWRDRCRRSWPPQSCRWSWRTRRTRSCRRPLSRCRRRTRKPHLSRPGPAQPERNALFKNGDRR